jgi:hypothetical protein
MKGLSIRVKAALRQGLKQGKWMSKLLADFLYWVCGNF